MKVLEADLCMYPVSFRCRGNGMGWDGMGCEANARISDGTLLLLTRKVEEEGVWLIVAHKYRT